MDNSSYSNVSDYSSSDYAFFQVHRNVSTAILSVIAVFGVIDNLVILLILVLCHQRHKANVLIGSLAVADLLYLAICVPLEIQRKRNYHVWYYGELLCRIGNSLPIALQTAAIYSLVALSANRFTTVVKLTPSSDGCLGGNVYIQVAIVWTGSALTSLTGIFGSKLITIYDTYTICTFLHFPDPIVDVVYALTYFAVLFVIPLVVIFVYYSRLAWHLYRSIQTLPDDGYLARHGQILARRRLAVVVLALVIMFIICWLPYHVSELLKVLYRYASHTVAPNVIIGIRDVLEFLTYAKSALNPVVLFTMSSFFRQRLRNSVRCKKPRQLQTYTYMNSKPVPSQRTRLTAVSSKL